MDHDLELHAVFGTDPRTVYESFLALHGEDRPPWIVRSELDLRVGGVWAVSFHPPGVAFFREVRVFSEVEPSRRLAYVMTAIFEGGESFATNVEMTFEPDGDRTRITLIQRGFPSDELRDEFGEGWASVMDVLDLRIAEGAERSGDAPAPAG